MPKEVFHTHITIARPMDGDPGTVEPGHYVVEDGTVTLTDREGGPIISGRLQIGYSAKMGDGETEAKVANRLLWRRYRATRSGSDFNRRITYPPLSVA
ncbi:hypothetical protein JQ608_34855 [Bradyrhizobium liaoningense]|uniref:hypothetical protein n=1 Tax=Bradyrhizobium liaoningense TaxID=43992 RepID=UPI001BAB0B9C|nr:hypothetical protein [Bradyrhizobium liaoningense]MBR0882235.1 hypothetical protein [Bradyrhizobium liaoningense]